MRNPKVPLYNPFIHTMLLIFFQFECCTFSEHDPTTRAPPASSHLSLQSMGADVCSTPSPSEAIQVARRLLEAHRKMDIELVRVVEGQEF